LKNKTSVANYYFHFPGNWVYKTVLLRGFVVNHHTKLDPSANFLS